mgnify:CR=1 FL=1
MVESYEKEKSYLENNVEASKSMTAWCADFSTELTGEVGTIEIDGNNEKGVLIYPAGCIGLYAAYNLSIHGAVSPSIALSPSNCYFNRAIFPAWQKYKPTFRLGEITALDGDLCAIDLDPSLSREQNLNINQTTTLVDVPIEYYCCDGTVFDVGDRVVISFENQDWTTPKVIGFESNPLPCEFDFIVKGSNTVFIVSSSGTNWGVTSAIDTTPMTIMNLNWRGRYVDGKPTLHLAWKGGNGRYFHTPSVPLNTPDNGDQVPLVRLPDIFKNGVSFALAPANVLGAAIQEVSGVDYLYVIGVDNTIYRTLADDVPDISTRLWTVMGAFVLGSLTTPADFMNDWFFNGAGTAAVCVQYDGLGNSQVLRQSIRFKLDVVDTVMNITTYGLQTVEFAGEVSSMTKTGDIVFAMDYKDDVIVEARLKVDISQTISDTSSIHNHVYEYEIGGVTHLHYESAGSSTSQLIPNDPEGNYEELSRTTTKSSATGILYMDLRYDVSIVVKGWWAVPYSSNNVGPIFTKLYIRQGANEDERDFLDDNGNGFRFSFGVHDSGLAVNQYGNIFLIKDSLATSSFMQIFAATSIDSGSMVWARISSWAHDPAKSLFTGGKTGTELGLGEAWTVGTKR